MTETLKSQVKRLMLANRRVGKGYRYTVPSPNSYPYQWLWDSCFHTIILSYFDLPMAKAELHTLVSRQLDNGMIPHMIYWERAPLSSFPHIAWGKQDTSSITQPPMLALAAWQVYQVDKDEAFLRQLYPAMRRYYEFFFHDRDPNKHKLVGIINPDESGEDNSPRFDLALRLPPKHNIDENFAKRLELIELNRKVGFSARSMENFYWVRDVSFNSILVRNLRLLADIALLLGHDDDASEYDELAESVGNAMRTYMMRPDGVMYSTYGRNYRKIETLTWAIFMPMFASIVTPDEAETLVKKHLLDDKEFATPYKVPTVAVNEPSFDPTGFWRGPIWIAANWFIYQGLKNYDFDAEASQIAKDARRLVVKSGFREYYNPMSGEGLGARDFTWGGLVLDMED